MLSAQQTVGLTFHGGEPTLIGPQQFDEWCNMAREALNEVATVTFKLQTNGTLLDDVWAKILRKHRVQVGISMDGPKELHDTNRVDHKGRGSYNRVERGLSVLQEAEVPFGILSVIQLGADPLAIHHHFTALGCDSISYLMPDFTHDTIAPIRRLYGPTPCADFLMPIFDEWWFNGATEIRISNLWHISRIILGGQSRTDVLGDQPFGFVVVETDGEIEGLDCLRVCEEGITKTGLNVIDDDFREIAHANALHARATFEGIPLPEVCRSCRERDTCGGGYLPHRYSRNEGFDNPSVWCADLLLLFTHIRHRMKISTEETRLRRQALRDIALQPDTGA